METKPDAKPLTAEDLKKVQDLTPDELKQISGGKSVMPSGVLAGYRILKVEDPQYVAAITTTATTTTPKT
jgi:hypothetical protein